MLPWFPFKHSLLHRSLLSLNTEQLSEMVQSCQTSPALSDRPPWRSELMCDFVCDYVFHARQAWIRLGRVCVYVIPLTHLTGRGKGLQQSWQCMTKCPPVNLPEWSWLLQWGRADETKHMWARDQRAVEEAGLDVSIFLARGQGDFVLGLKDGKLGIDRATVGHWKTGTIVPGLGLEGVLFLCRDGKLSDNELDGCLHVCPLTSADDHFLCHGTCWVECSKVWFFIWWPYSSLWVFLTHWGFFFLCRHFRLVIFLSSRNQQRNHEAEIRASAFKFHLLFYAKSSGQTLIELINHLASCRNWLIILEPSGKIYSTDDSDWRQQHSSWL